MPENNYTCRDKYYNYGSYLRSRGFDKEICTLLADIGNGNSNIGPIDPGGSCSSGDPTTINNNVVINPCENDITNSTGTLLINGGDPANPSIQAMHGGHFDGDVIIRGNLSVTGDLEDLTPLSVHESLNIDTRNGYKGDSFSIHQSQANTKGNIQSMWMDSSRNTGDIDSWKNSLVFSIDGPGGTDGATDQSGHTRILRGATICNSNVVSDISYNHSPGSDVALNVYGELHVYADNSGPGLIIVDDLSANDISVNNIDINNLLTVSDLSVEDLSVDGMHVNTFAFIQDLSANDISVNNIDINSLLTVSELSVEDLSVDGMHVNTFAFIQDLSANDISVNNIDINNLLTVSDLSVEDLSVDDMHVNTFAFIQDLSANDISVNNLHVHNDIIFNKNPLVDRGTTFGTYTNFGTAKAVIKMEPGSTTLNNANTSTLLNCPAIDPPPPITHYSNYPPDTFSDASHNIITNTDFFKNSIMEFSVSLDCSFNSISNGLRCVLENGANQLKIDARSISGLTYEKLVFGPVSYYTTNDDNYYKDIDIANNLNVRLEIMGAPGGKVYDISNVRLTMTTTNIEN